MRALPLLICAALVAHAADRDLPALLEPKVPAVVVKLAEAYAKSHPAGNGDWSTFESTFFTGFTQPNVTIVQPNDAQKRGFEAGKSYRKANPEKVKEILEGYGYEAIEVKGTYRHAFEISEFRSEKNPDERWWVSELQEEGKWVARDDLGRMGERVQVVVKGYLSPPGSYGHMGSGSRELIAQSITVVKP